MCDYQMFIVILLLVSVSEPCVPPGICGQVRGPRLGPDQRDDLLQGPVRQSRGPRGPGPSVPDDCAAEEWPHQGGLVTIVIRGCYCQTVSIWLGLVWQKIINPLPPLRPSLLVKINKCFSLLNSRWYFCSLASVNPLKWRFYQIES